MVICIKVTGETFSLHHKRKGAEEVRYQKYPNFQIKEPLPDRALELQNGDILLLYPHTSCQGKSKVCPRFAKIIFC